jgi:hypothetical protein
MMYKRINERGLVRTDEARLRDGAAAVKTLSEPKPESLEGLEERLAIIMDGALALQSTEDQGSPEANQAVWDDMLRLQKEGDELGVKIQALKNAKE